MSVTVTLRDIAIESTGLSQSQITAIVTFNIRDDTSGSQFDIPTRAATVLGLNEAVDEAKTMLEQFAIELQSAAANFTFP
jgi:hypothetical protein